MRRFLLLLFALVCVCAHADTNATNNTYAAHIAKLPKLEGFTILVEPPFVIIGNESAEMVSRRATGSVRWAVSKLKKDFFRNDPEQIIDIWLFRDRESYTNYAWKLFKDRPTTPFGYYS